MFKKLFLMLCSLMLLVGCGSDSQSAQSDIIGTKYQSIREQRKNGTSTNTNQGQSTQAAAKTNVNKENLIKIGFCQVGAESGWRIAHTNSMKDMFTEANGYQLDFVNADGDQAKQIDALKKFIKNKVQVIVLAPVVETGWDSILKEAKSANIPVIIVDRMIKTNDDSLYTCWVGSNFNAEGTNAVEWLVKYMESNGKGSDKHKVVMLQGTPGASAEIGRTQGVHSGLSKYSNYEIVFEKTANFTKDEGKQVMAEYLKTSKDFDVLISQNDDMTFGAIEALKDAGLKPGSDVTIISFDGVKDAFQSMIDGEINADIECNPLQGPFVAELIQKVLAKENIEKIQYMYESVYDASVAQKEIGNRVY